MKGKKACRNLRGSYIDDLVGELERLESAGLSTDGTQINEGVQDTRIVSLPDGNRCKLVKSSLAVAKLGGVMAFTAYLVCEDEAEPVIVVDRLFDQLSETFNRAQLRAVLEQQGMTTPERVFICQWKRLRVIEEVEKGTYHKLDVKC